MPMIQAQILVLLEKHHVYGMSHRHSGEGQDGEIEDGDEACRYACAAMGCPFCQSPKLRTPSHQGCHLIRYNRV